MKTEKKEQLLDTLNNGNRKDFKKWLKRCSKLDLLEFISFQKNWGKQSNHAFIADLARWLEDMKN